MRRLFLIRHAKAELSVGRDDYARKLTERGRADARRVARTLAARRFLPELLIHSGAARAKETADIFAFLTTFPNAVVKPIHEQAMPVILRKSEEIDVWMNAPAEEALQLQRPLPDNELIVLPQPKAEEEEPLLL